MVIKIGTRASKLALAQTQWVIDRISARYPDITVDLVKIKTKGDKTIDRPLSDVGGKGLFVREIEEALQRKEIDAAVHSLKDVPAKVQDDLYIGVIPEREDPYDVLISRDNIALKDLPERSSIGTSSLRRAAQLLHCRADLTVTPLRGNLDTRLRKLYTADIHAIIVAAAGLKRMGFGDKITQYFPPDIMLPAIGQGALGLELRRDDEKTRNMLTFLDHHPTRTAVEAERSFLVEIGGGCELPVAALAQFHNESIHLDALVANLDGTRIFRDAIEGPADKAGELGTNLARKLVDAGARQILDEIYGPL